MSTMTANGDNDGISGLNHGGVDTHCMNIELCKRTSETLKSKV